MYQLFITAGSLYNKIFPLSWRGTVTEVAFILAIGLSLAFYSGHLK